MDLMRGIILEGYSNAGKTSTLKALKLLQAQEAFHENAERSVVVLSEHYSQICNRVNGKIEFLNREEHLQLLRDRVQMLKQLNDWAQKLGADSREPRGILFILERFHLNHRVAFPHSDLSELIELEEMLLQFGAKCVLLTLSPEIVEQRIQSRRPQEWAKRSKEYIQEQCNELLSVQNSLRNEAKNSSIPTFEINTDEKDWNMYAKEILELV